MKRLEKRAVSAPGKSSAGAHTKADVTFAIQKREAGILVIPATRGMTARKGPKKRPMKTLLPPWRSKKAYLLPASRDAL